MTLNFNKLETSSPKDGFSLFCMVEYSGSVDERVKQVHIRRESNGETYRHTDGLRTEKTHLSFSAQVS